MNTEKKHHCQHEHYVKVTLNGDETRIKSGRYIISKLKQILEVPVEYELEIIKNGEFITLDDNDEITICGKEEFISHIKCGGSS